MTDFIQLLFSGLATGAIYALVALGFTLLWQASGTINFAQGEFVMLPAKPHARGAYPTTTIIDDAAYDNDSEGAAAALSGDAGGVR